MTCLDTIRTPILFWISAGPDWRGMRMYIGRPSLRELRKIVRDNPLAWIEA